MILTNDQLAEIAAHLLGRTARDRLANPTLISEALPDLADELFDITIDEDATDHDVLDVMANRIAEFVYSMDVMVYLDGCLVDIYRGSKED
jgi:hypothetical protein